MAQTTFDKSFDRVFTHEGGFQNDPDDRANWTSGKIGEGELKGTKCGISAMTYPELDIKNLEMDMIKEIYYQDWWIALGMEIYRPAMAYQMFDAALNHGMKTASRLLQRAVSVHDDGIIGAITRRTVTSFDLDDLLLNFLAERLMFMTKIKIFDKYGRGWTRRIALNLKLAALDN